MPLVIICGVPLSGKTFRAKQIAKYIEAYIFQEQESLLQRGLGFDSKVIIINDESLGIDKSTGYSNATIEKITRGTLLSATGRHLSKNTVVICDGMNNIKGFRYQLYCVARALGTPTCTIHCGISLDTAKQSNIDLKVYDQDLFDNLCSRFEDPDGRNRWDAPLFTVIPEDSDMSDLTCETARQIVEAILLKKPPAPNLSTVVKPLTATNYLHEMDKTLSDIIEAFVDAQKSGRTGNIVISQSSAQLNIPSRTITPAELRRLKRQYTNINKMLTLLDMDKVAQGFADYLNTNLS
ncbi:hypothetical protein BATDEDRAFT_92837 [Batrachochytrium dendrobatidis JAM81]|uniref:Chromatin associated protein KTI12 n=2 Tax=Batrachochytrium dendrobatidis TaxID=109871 RepID=F4PEM1_BATDJ|nr:uncharacterized protein BATDEDRAFT_92837 [Batrachochytrium dendrobatidis JAM81]EGF76326.1 hypothetical protein BATDEDRAFT_92837 [Batrachochytrium dendrobatidis JAM81]KAJ8323667.1 kti12, chromatin associated [Batrachochytrium dendrobatidis]KAK5666413.1 kti12, chromatin associated [Batrachochytrium dendrobatidis]OAJ43029.1 hypothetical protein BDEG_26412 [Batrachochytrium dendrobatidis JEL423]|eukprot:XP_006683119.1 hypothetical protein BATDEDRAFT_92837 [Batrachochytrium dendrobatidis JAM81]